MSIRLALIAAAGGAVLVGAGWAAWDWHGDARYGDGYQQAISDTKAHADAEALASATRLAALEHAHAEIRRLENEKESALAVAVNAGRVRLHVNADCPGLPEAADPSMGQGARTELAAAARQDYYALRSGLIEARADLDLCRAAVRELTSSP